jgi:hypothetical protein
MNLSALLTPAPLRNTWFRMLNNLMGTTRLTANYEKMNEILFQVFLVIYFWQDFLQKIFQPQQVLLEIEPYLQWERTQCLLRLGRVWELNSLVSENFNLNLILNQLGVDMPRVYPEYANVKFPLGSWVEKGSTFFPLPKKCSNKIFFFYFFLW